MFSVHISFHSYQHTLSLFSNSWNMKRKHSCTSSEEFYSSGEDEEITTSPCSTTTESEQERPKTASSSRISPSPTETRPPESSTRVKGMFTTRATSLGAKPLKTKAGMSTPWGTVEAATSSFSKKLKAEKTESLIIRPRTTQQRIEPFSAASHRNVGPSSAYATTTQKPKGITGTPWSWHPGVQGTCTTRLSVFLLKRQNRKTMTSRMIHKTFIVATNSDNNNKYNI